MTGAVELKTVKEAAEILRKTPNAVYLMIQRKEIMAVHLGRRLRLDMRDIRKLVDNNRY